MIFSAHCAGEDFCFTRDVEWALFLSAGFFKLVLFSLCRPRAGRGFRPVGRGRSSRSYFLASQIVRAKSTPFTLPQAEEFIFASLLLLFPKAQALLGTLIPKRTYRRLAQKLRKTFHVFLVLLNADGNAVGSVGVWVLPGTARRESGDNQVEALRAGGKQGGLWPFAMGIWALVR